MVYHVQFPGLGLDLTVNRVALAIGGFNIYWYGVIIAAGMLLAMLYAFRNAVDYGIDSPSGGRCGHRHGHGHRLCPYLLRSYGTLCVSKPLGDD